MRVNNIALSQEAEMVANTVVYLEDGTPVNFVYEVHGLPSFKTERKKAVMLEFKGHNVPVLPLERIRKSKEFVGRDKDRLHILQIDEFLACSQPPRKAKKKAKRLRGKSANPDSFQRSNVHRLRLR